MSHPVMSVLAVFGFAIDRWSMASLILPDSGMHAEPDLDQRGAHLKAGLSKPATIVCWVAAIAVMSLVSAADSRDLSPDTGRNPPSTLWSFRAIRHVSPPAPENKAWVNNPLDAFVLTKLEHNNLTPAPPAGPLALLRRVHFDLTGLPPTPEEIEAFEKDKRPEAYAELVERLLSSSQYGERWGRHWLDVVRYADTGGFEAGHVYDNAWRYRDYVIRSFNADKPFDQFMQEQIAGERRTDRLVQREREVAGDEGPERAQPAQRLSVRAPHFCVSHVRRV